MSTSIHTFASIDYAQLLGHEWRFAHPELLVLAWCAPVLVIITMLSSRRATRKLNRIADSEMIESLTGTRRHWNSVLKTMTTALVVISTSIAIAQPQSDPRDVSVEARGRDVVFLVDVSRSMLAKDVAPNRLEKSKLWMNDLVDELRNDRVGLVAFAGSSSVLSPLTTDRLFFKLALEELSPASVLVGGTNIGDAIRKTMDLVFIDHEDGPAETFRDLVIISDGEDQESLPVEAARLAGARGVRVIAIGIGSDKGAMVPSSKEARAGSQTQIRSKLESGTLRAIAAASPGGVYLEVGTGTIDLAQVYNDLISSADQHTIDTSTQVQFTERYMYFIVIALIFLVFHTLIPNGSRRALT